MTPPPLSALNYSQAGVNAVAADLLVNQIARLAKSTLNKNVKSSIGGYASLYAIDAQKFLAASTDGVGTKLKLAFMLGEHRTVGIDLVAMSVNDLLCVGAEPLFFLDYFATGKLHPQTALQVLEGIVEGCRQAGCALVGGETAEMPDFYQAGEYDLAGFAVGMVEAKDVLPKKEIKPGDVLLGLGSSGFHSNGYSLLRKLLPEGEEGYARARELLTPTRIYVKALRSLLKRRREKRNKRGVKGGVQEGAIKGLAHITGSGFLNIPRVSENVSYEICLPPLSERPSIFAWVKERSGLSLEELAKTFNLGIGMVVITAEEVAKELLRSFRRQGEMAWRIGHVVRKRPKKNSEIHLLDEGQSVTLSY